MLFYCMPQINPIFKSSLTFLVKSGLLLISMLCLIVISVVYFNEISMICKPYWIPYWMPNWMAPYMPFWAPVCKPIWILSDILYSMPYLILVLISVVGSIMFDKIFN